jgi:hypothetical protein
MRGQKQAQPAFGQADWMKRSQAAPRGRGPKCPALQRQRLRGGVQRQKSEVDFGRTREEGKGQAWSWWS